MQAHFGENVCKNERIGSRRGGVHRKFLHVDPPLHLLFTNIFQSHTPESISHTSANHISIFMWHIIVFP